MKSILRAGVGLLAMHLNHGIQSLFQTLGWNTAKVRPLLENGSRVFSWLDKRLTAEP